MVVAMKARTKRTVLAYAMAILLALNLLPLSAFAEASDGERTAQAVSDRVSNSPVGSGDDALTDPTANRQAVEAADEAPVEGALDDFSEESSGGSPSIDDSDGVASGGESDGTASGLRNGLESADPEGSAEPDDGAALLAADPVDISTLLPPSSNGTILGGMDVEMRDANGNPLPAGQDPTIDSIIHLGFPLSIPADTTDQIKAGDYYTFELPDTVTVPAGIKSVALVDPDDASIVYANFTVSPSKPGTRAVVTITFTDAVTGKGDVTGQMGFSGGLNADAIGKPGETEIKLPFENSVPPASITIVPATDSDVSKSGNFDQPRNPTSISWSVDINKSLKQMNNASVAESFPSGLTFEGVEVYQVPVDFYGNVIGEPGDAGWTKLDAVGYTASSDGTKVTLNSPYDSTKEAYRFVYKTTIEDDVKDLSGGDVAFTNKAVLHSDDTGADGLPAQATVSANFGKMIDKKGSTYDPSTRLITWQVQYNYGGRTIPAGDAWVEDICDYPDLEFIADSVTVQKMKFDSKGNAVVESGLSEGAGAGQYTFSQDLGSKSIKVGFNSDVDYPVLITYQTKVTSVIDANKTYVNTAITSGNPPSIAHDRITVGQHNLVKTVDGVDIANKTITWKIDINKSRYPMQSFTLTDTLVLGLSHTISNGANIEVHDVTAGKAVPEAGDFTGDGYTLRLSTDSSGNHIGFNLAFVGSYGSTDHEFAITYKTSYDAMHNPPDGSQEFVNIASSSWYDASGGHHSNTGRASYRPTPPDGSNGMKSGSYNAVDKKITWSVLVNYARTGLKGASISDMILPGQTFVDGSLSVYSYTIRSNGTTVKGPELTAEQMASLDVTLPSDDNEQTLTVGFPDGDELYWIEFDTSVEGTVIEAAYDNVAILHNEAESVKDTSLKAKVSVKHGGSLAEKSGYQDSDGAAVWSLTVNPNNSKLSDVLVTDTPSSNQFVNLDSIAINGTTVDKAGNLTLDPSSVLVRDTDYTVDYVQDENGVWQLKIAFANTIDSAYIVTYKATLYADSSVPLSQATNTATITGNNLKTVTDNTTGSILVQLTDGSGILKGTRKDLILHKTDLGGNDLPGAKFQLFNSHGQPIGGVVSTDENGAISFAGIVTGTYTLKEVEPAPGYTMSEELAAGITVLLEADSGPVEITNDLTEVKLVKQNTEGAAVGGAEFSLERFDGGAWSPVASLPEPLDLVSKADGSIVIRGLEPGHYRLSEVAAPYPYVLGEPREFDVSYRSDDVKIVDPVDLGSYVNERFAATLNILKTDVDGAPLAKAEFELRDLSGAVVKGGIVTGSDGRASVAGIDEGSYVLVETKAPEGYQLDQTPHEIEAVYDQAGQTIEITLVNFAEPIPRIPDVTNPPTTPHPADTPKTPIPASGLVQTGDGYLVAGIGALAALAVVAAAAAGAFALRRKRNASE